MEIQSLRYLQTADDQALLFGRLGLSTGGTLDPELVAQYQQEVIAEADLGAEVPEATRRAFERLRRLHAHGVLLYDAYTIASEQAPFVLDLALGERFVAFYRSDGVPLVHGGRRRTLTITSFEDFKQRDLPQANRELQEIAGDRARWKLECRPGQRMKFSGSFTHLLLWARNVSLLHGQRNRALERAIGRLRNHAAHPAGYVLEGPVQSARMIWDVAEMINRLWEADATGRRLYPEPVRREVMAVGWGGDDGTIVSFHADPHRKMPDDAKTYVVVRGVPDDPDLPQYSARYEKTFYPADLLFGPGTWREAQEWLLANNPTADAVNYLDRLFAVRERDGQVDLPRRPSVAAALPEDERSGTWHLLRADHPNWAYAHVRGSAGRLKESCAQSGPCRNCQVEVLGRGSWQQLVAEHESDSVRLADIEVPSPWSLA
jgi:hypothetical protein